MRRARVLVVLLVLLGACGSDDSTAAPTRPTGTIQVFAATSLTEAFTAMGKDFERAHRGAKVAFNFAASSALAQQLTDGAPADVFASADEATMAKVEAATSTPRDFARNRLTILVAPENPKAVQGLRDLARADLTVVLCAPEVPCGKYAKVALDKAGVTVKASSLEDNVKGVVSRVTLGEADAGIVYVTDAKAAAGQADAVGIENASDPDVEAVYPIAVTADTTHAALAEAWVTYVLSTKGHAALRRFGFLPPGF